MKKLLTGFAITSLIAISMIQAQPIAEDARFIQLGSTYSGQLNPLVHEGNPPYLYSFHQAIGDDIEVLVFPDGRFIATVPMRYSGDAQFQYRAADADGTLSNPGTITIQFGQEKG